MKAWDIFGLKNLAFIKIYIKYSFEKNLLLQEIVSQFFVNFLIFIFNTGNNLFLGHNLCKILDPDPNSDVGWIRNGIRVKRLGTVRIQNH